MNKLKCIDDVHSQQNGLTQQNVLNLMDSLEKKLSVIKEPVCKDRAFVSCYLFCRFII